MKGKKYGKNTVFLILQFCTSFTTDLHCLCLDIDCDVVDILDRVLYSSEVFSCKILITISPLVKKRICMFYRLIKMGYFLLKTEGKGFVFLEKRCLKNGSFSRKTFPNKRKGRECSDGTPPSCCAAILLFCVWVWCIFILHN